MSESDNFLGFEDFLHFCAFITQVIYNIIPIIFFYQLFHNVIKIERISIISITSLYLNALIYFFTSISCQNHKDIQHVNPLDFCNIIGLYLGFLYFAIYHYFLYFDNNLKRFIISISILLVISLSIILIILKTVDNKDDSPYKIFNWYLGTFFNIFENLPLGFDIIYLIKNKISEKFTLFGATGGIVNTTIWLIWAIKKLVKGEPIAYSILANSIGICLHILQFVLFFIFRKDNDDINDNNVEINPNDEENLITSEEEKKEEEKKKEEYDIIENFI